ncbi:MAG TPA: hypothetical protein VG943_16215 [Caulobacterales bacterium]|nr:hypothetical protein [Caulobacterales bacterium]
MAAAARNAAQHWRTAAVAGFAGAVFSSLLSLLSVVATSAAPVWTLLSIVVSAFVYAALIGGALQGPSGLSQRVATEGWRMLGAMAVVGFFLFIVFVVAIVADAFILAFAAADYLPQLQAAGEDPTRVFEVMTRFAQARPGVPIAVFLLNAFVWMALTSRLYLAAPATYEAQRILTFDTWPWTKGNMLRILAARLLLLLPVYLITQALGVGVNLALTPNMLDAEALQAAVRASPALFAVLSVVIEFVQFAVYFALEAALSVQVYRVLRPQAKTAEAFR